MAARAIYASWLAADASTLSSMLVMVVFVVIVRVGMRLGWMDV